MIAQGRNLKPLFADKTAVLIWTFLTVIIWSVNLPVLFIAYLGATGSTLFDTEFGDPLLKTFIVWGVFGTIAGSMTGIIAGVIQWFVLRPQTHWAGQWLRNSIFGWVTGWGLVFGVVAFLSRSVQFGLDSKMERVIFWSVILSCVGIVIGYSQWIVLRQHTLRASWWLSVNAVVLPTGIIVGSLVTKPRLDSILGYILWGGTAGLIIGVVTGWIIVWLLQNQKPLPK